MALPAQLHASAALAPYCLKNCDADAPGQKLENLPKGGMAQAEQEGRVRSSRRVCRSKRRVAISKRIVVRSSKSVQVQKKCNEVQKSVFHSGALVYEFQRKIIHAPEFRMQVLQDINASVHTLKRHSIVGLHSYCSTRRNGS